MAASGAASGAASDATSGAASGAPSGAASGAASGARESCIVVSGGAEEDVPTCEWSEGRWSAVNGRARRRGHLWME